MSNKTMGIIGVAAVVVVLGVGAAWYMMQSSGDALSSGAIVGTSGAVNPDTSTTTTTVTTSTQTTSEGSGINAGSNTDASLQQDTASIDAQMNALSSDNASTDTGLSSN